MKLNESKIRKMIDEQIRKALRACSVRTNFVTPGKVGRPFGFKPKKTKE